MSNNFTSIPDIPPKQNDEMEDFLTAVKENLEILLAKRSSKLKKQRAVTLQDLLDLELISEDDLKKVR